jgi:hypothetical protein
LIEIAFSLLILREGSLPATDQRVPHTPGFPVKFGGLDALHAALLNESRTRGRLLVPRTGNPGISLVFREMWDTTVLHPEPLVASKS